MLTLSFWMLTTACGDKTESSDTASMDTSTVETDDTGPTEPDSITIETTGSESLALMFDTPSCQIPSAAPNFNAFWRNGSGAHVFVLRVMLRGEYEGAGTYSTDSNELLVTLQEEAGGQGRYYAVDSEQGDSATIVLNIDDTGIVWGTLNVNSLHSAEGGISMTTTDIPLWCDADNTAGIDQ